jgi:hypothetical protein
LFERIRCRRAIFLPEEEEEEEDEKFCCCTKLCEADKEDDAEDIIVIGVRGR